MADLTTNPVFCKPSKVFHWEINWFTLKILRLSQIFGYIIARKHLQAGRKFCLSSLTHSTESYITKNVGPDSKVHWTGHHDVELNKPNTGLTHSKQCQTGHKACELDKVETDGLSLKRIRTARKVKQAFLILYFKIKERPLWFRFVIWLEHSTWYSLAWDECCFFIFRWEIMPLDFDNPVPSKAFKTYRSQSMSLCSSTKPLLRKFLKWESTSQMVYLSIVTCLASSEVPACRVMQGTYKPPGEYHATSYILYLAMRFAK